MRVWSRFALFLFAVVAAGGALAQFTTLGVSSNPTNASAAGDHMYFQATTSAVGLQLYRTDGTPESTTRLTYFPAPTVVSNVFEHQGRSMFFAALDSLVLFETDGTNAWPRTALSLTARGISWVTSTGSSIVFLTPAATGQYNLWQTDGNSGNVTFVAAVTSQFTPYVFASGGRLYFFAHNADNTTDLWTSDGTGAGTTKIKTSVYDAVPFRGRVLASCFDGLWSIDGAAAPVQLVVGSSVATIAAGADTAFLALGGGLIKTDGTPAGTVLVKSMNLISFVRVLSSGVAVFARPNGTALEFWSSDGTEAGTVKYVEVPTQAEPRSPIVGTTNHVFFVLNGKQQDLWKTDGTAAGTVKVRALTAGVSSSYFGGWAFHDDVMLGVDDQVHGLEPWFSDGTAAGTMMLANLSPEAVLRGHVKDAETSAPLPGTTVSISNTSGLVLGTFPVNADGTFTVEGPRPGSYKLRTNSTDSHIDKGWPETECIPQCAYNTGDAFSVSDVAVHDGYDFSLRRGALIQGTVSSSPTENIGATIHIGPAYGNQTWATSSDGAYRIGTVPPGSYVIWATGNPLSTIIYPSVSCAAGCDASSAAPQFYAAGVYTRDFAMKVFGSVSGQVRSTRADLTPTASVYLYRAGSDSYDYSASTHSGNWSERLMDGQWQLYVEPNDGAHVGSWYSTSGCRPCTRAQATIVSAVPGVTTPGYDVVLPHIGSTITGTITDRINGAVVPGANVYAVKSGENPVTAKTNASGVYSITVPAGTYYVYTEAFGSYPSEVYDGAGGRVCNACDVTTGTPIVAGEEQTVSNINLSLIGNGTISGRVTESATNAAVPFKSVSVYTADGAFKASGSTDASGNYSIVVPASASYYVAFPTSSPFLGELYNNIPCSSACVVTNGTLVTIPVSGARTGVDFTVDRAGSLTGTVIDNASSKGLPNVGLTLSGPGLPTRYGGTTPSGTFSIANVQDGTYTLTVEATGYATTTRSVTIALNQTTNITVRLNATAGAAAIILGGPPLTKAKP